MDWSAIPRADVKQNPMIMSCHSRFRLSMFCLATTGVTGCDSGSVVCEVGGCVGGECDDLGRRWDINGKIERRKRVKR